MSMAKVKHIIVFGVNIDSFNRYQVKIGKTMSPVEEAINLADQAEPVESTIILQPYQKATDVGTPITIAESRALSFQNSDID